MSHGACPTISRARGTETLSNPDAYGVLMLVYHGAPASIVDDVLKHGLKPRDLTGRSNWEHNSNPSISGHVYLSRLYAGYFGVCSVQDDEPVAIFEIDLDQLNSNQLFPDEDYIEQALRDIQADHLPVQFRHIIKQLKTAGGMTKRTEIIRKHIHLFRGFAFLSLDRLGNISFAGTIPPTAIKRVSIWNPGENPAFTSALMDPTITIMNAQFVGQKYVEMTKWLMGDEPNIDAYMEASFGPKQNLNPQFAAMYDVSRKQLEQMLEIGKPTVTSL